MENATRKIGQNRGKPRLWIEGKLLTDAGFMHGDKWDIVHFANGFDILRNPQGKRRIAGKADRPVIDIAGNGLGAMAQGVALVELTYQPNGDCIHVRAI